MQPPIERAEQVAQIAASLGIETALIGAYALAVHGYVRASLHVDLASYVDVAELTQLDEALRAVGFQTRLLKPDDRDLGGVLKIWNEIDEDGEALEPVELVNFKNPHRPRKTPAPRAIRNALPLDEMPALRCPTLADLIAMELLKGARRGAADAVELLIQNPTADREAIRSVANELGFDPIDELIAEAQVEIERAAR